MSEIQQHVYDLEGVGADKSTKDGMIGTPLPSNLQNLVDTITYVQFQCSTTCYITLKKCGFTVTGESHCLDPSKYNEKLGQEAALQDATDKLLSLEIYYYHRVLIDNNQ